MAKKDKFVPYESFTTLALFDKYTEAINDRDAALAARGDNRWGIRVAKDHYARQYQKADNLVARLHNEIRERLAAAQVAKGS